MKKKIIGFVFCILSAFVLPFFVQANIENNKASAFTKTENTYSVKQNGNLFIVTSGLSDTVVEENILSFETAISVINTNTLSETTEIYFDNISLDNESNITLSKNYILSGILNSKNTSPIFKIENTDSENPISIYFEDFTLSNTVSSNTNLNLIEISSDSNKVNLTIDNSVFNNTVENPTADEVNTHAFYFKSASHNIHFENTASHTTEFLLNALKYNTISANVETFFMQDPETPMPETETLKISVPNTAFGLSVYSGLTYNYSKRFEALREFNFYEISKTTTSDSLIVTSSQSISFDPNSATFIDESLVPNSFTFNHYTFESVNFPEASNMNLDHYHFDGWFGKISYNSKTYYFDQTCLKNYIDAGEIASTIPTCFKTNINSFSIENSFSKYSYHSNGTENSLSEFESVNFFSNQKTNPSFIAKWNINNHTVNFYDSHNYKLLHLENLNFGEKITNPTPTKTGYTFSGWFTEIELINIFNFETTNMPDNNLNLYAGWNVNSYKIHYITNTSQSINSDTFNFGSEITLPADPIDTGKVFVGWFEYDENEDTLSDTPFSLRYMPANDIILHAVWTDEFYNVSFKTEDGFLISSTNVAYLNEIEKPTDPTKQGYTFRGWFYTKEALNGTQVIFNQNNAIVVTSDLEIFAHFTINIYKLSIHTNKNGEITTKYITFNEKITLEESPTHENHIFKGYFTSPEFQNKFNLKNMPANDIDIYINWLKKPLPTLDENIQTYFANDHILYYQENSNLNGFIIKYFINGVWVSEPPTAVGSYDVLITRAEDDNYSSYSKIIKNGLVIKPVIKDFDWLIALLFVTAVLEFAAAFIVKRLRKMKTNMIVTSIAITYGFNIIEQNQVILLIISGSLALAGFIFLAYQLVSLHRTVPIDLVHERDEREEALKHFEHSEKVLKESANEYSASDIEKLLENDTVGKSIKSKHNLDDLVRDEESAQNYIYEDEEYDSNNPENSDDLETSNFENLNTDETYSSSIDNGFSNTNSNTIKTFNENELYEEVETFDDDEVQISDDEEERLYDSEDPFLKRDPNDYFDK